MLISNVKLLLHQLPLFLHGRDLRLAALAVSAVVIAASAWLLLREQPPSSSEMEHRRRERLSAIGRITDGVLLETRSLAGEETTVPSPQVLVYSYRLAGVTYECAQDVSPFPDRVTDCRLDQPVQVRYDPRSPGNSLLVSESWSGLWNPWLRS